MVRLAPWIPLRGTGRREEKAATASECHGIFLSRLVFRLSAHRSLSKMKYNPKYQLCQELCGPHGANVGFSFSRGGLQLSWTQPILGASRGTQFVHSPASSHLAAQQSCRWVDERKVSTLSLIPREMCKTQNFGRLAVSSAKNKGLKRSRQGQTQPCPAPHATQAHQISSSQT